MATLIVQLTDFEQRPYRIPNQTESKDLYAFIEVAEEKILRELFGHDMYEELEDQLSGTPGAVWVALRDGAEYAYNSQNYKYGGLKAILVPRIYSEWITETRDKYTDVGVVYNTSDNNERVSPARRIVEAYNAYARLVGDYWNQCNTLYGYMEANEADFPDWDPDNLFDPPGRINEFGL